MNKPTASSGRFIWLLVTVALAAAGTGLWFGGMYYARSAMNGKGPTHDKMSAAENMDGMSNMAGMQMGGMDSASGEFAGTPSETPGHSELRVSPELQQRIGVTTGKVELAPLKMSVRTVGLVQPDETRVAHVHLKTEGWIEKLFVNFTGQKVEEGEQLLAIYSPDFLSTQREYLIARQAAGAGGAALATTQQSLADAARRRLELWDVPDEELAQLEQSGQPQKSLILRSPLSGSVLKKDVYEGMRVSPEDELYVVGDLSSVWVQAKVYEYELPHVELGHPVKVTVPALPGREFEGKVNFIEPVLEEATRTVQVRVELPNQDEALKPGMFVHAEIEHTMGEGLLVPAPAVLRTGERDIVYRVESAKDQGERFAPVDVELDTVNFGGRFHVLEGLEEGDRVVTSANFLIDSESRLRAGGGSMAGMPGMDMGEMNGIEMEGMGQSEMQEMDHSKMKH